MGLFDKKNKKEENRRYTSELPKVPEPPELPELPELPSLDDDYRDEPIPQLPSFPLNSLGAKFSQDTIKEAVTGKKEGKEVLNADEFPYENDSEIMHKPLNKNKREDFENYEESEFPIKPRYQEISRGFKERSYATKKAEPVFIRIDKFEESLGLFENIKDQISEIEHLIKNTKEIKAKEEEELNSWEMQLQEIKKQVERVNQDIFSKLE
ncbi:MAG: hypothetical protein ABIE36_02155 [Candidatus Diapherotrites archaeon]